MLSIRIESVSFSYGRGRRGRKKLFNALTMTIPLEGVTFLQAPSGTGKTTLLKLIGGLLTPESGTITGVPAGPIGWCFQENRLLPWRTVLENAALAGDPVRAAYLLERLGLGDEKETYPSSLSGGMARRAALARALAVKPVLLLLDEPFTGLDQQLRAAAADLIRKAECPTLIVSHEAGDRLLFPEAAAVDIMV